ncbi:MAG: membrane protein insertase YidC, partial [Bacteroidetes bacterium]|nr:membrane protein insertase YidC [Bacteroidota bacterium]
MEEKKFDPNSLIGFILLFGIVVWMWYTQQPTDAEVAAEKAKKELVVKEEANAVSSPKSNESSVVAASNDTLQTAKLQKTLGNFAYSAGLPSAKGGVTTIENDLVILKIANK